MDKPKKIILANATKEQHIEMMKSVMDELPEGNCDTCGKEGVKVFPMTNMDDPSKHAQICFECITGEGIEVQACGDPANN